MVPTPHKVFRLAEDPTYPIFRAENILRSFLEKVSAEIQLQSITHMTEYMYVVTNEPLEKIPRLVTNAFSFTPNTVAERDFILAESKQVLGEIQSLGVQRLTPAEVLAELETHVEGLNSIRAAVISKKAQYADYARHLNYVLSTPTGRLLTAPPLNRQINLLKDFSSLKKDLQLKVSAGDVRRAMQQFYPQFRAYWAASQSLWKKSLASGEEKELYFLLSRLIETTPRAIVATLVKYPAYRSHLCWILGRLDSVVFSDLWEKSFTGIWNKISLPLWVVGIAVIPVLATGAPLIIMYTGLAALQVAGLVEVHGTYKHMVQLQQYRNFHENMMTSGLGSEYSVPKMLEIDRSIEKDMNKIGTSVALEVFSFGFAHALSKATFKTVEKMSRTDIAQKFYAVIAKRNRVSFVLESRLAQTQTMNAYLDKLAATKKPYRHHSARRDWVYNTVQNMPQKELESILFQSRDYGFGRTLFLTEAATALSMQAYDITTQDYFGGIKPWKYLFPQ